MSHQSLPYPIISLLLGLIVGFTFANNVNRNGSGSDATPAKLAAGNAILPPDQPPITGEAGDMAGRTEPQLMASEPI